MKKPDSHPGFPLVFDLAFTPQFPGKRAGKVASALGVSKRNCAYFPRVAGSAHQSFSPSCRRHFFGLRFFTCSPGFHPAGAGRPTLDHGIPRLIHTFRQVAGVTPSSSSETPGWNPHDGQISYDPPPDFPRGASSRFGQWQAGHEYFIGFRGFGCSEGGQAGVRNSRGCSV